VGIRHINIQKEEFMTTNKTLLALVLTPALVLSGCINMPTPSSQITGSYASGLRYENYECSQLAVELDSLARRENQLTIAQEQRVKTSQMQAFWWGFGQGDGIEASELANVRGEKEAVRKALEGKACHRQQAQPHIPPTPVAKPVITTGQQDNPNRSSPYIYELKRN
jgi:hypothetical protein